MNVIILVILLSVGFFSDCGRQSCDRSEKADSKAKYGEGQGRSSEGEAVGVGKSPASRTEQEYSGEKRELGAHLDLPWLHSFSRAADLPEDRKKKPFTLEALYQTKRILSPTWSPDGKWIVYSVISDSLTEGRTDIDVYRIKSDGTEQRRLTRYRGSDSGAQFSPDGRYISFISDRENGAQIWIMPVDGGEPEQLSHVSTGVSKHRWSGDSKKIAFTSRVFPEYGADDKKNKKLIDDIENSPTKAHIADNLFFRHWDSYRGTRRSHVLVLSLDTKTVEDVTEGEFDVPGIHNGTGFGFDFSPDSEELCFTSNQENVETEAWSTNADLFTVSLNNGQKTNITKKNGAFDGQPVYSPNGKYIAYLRQNLTGFESDRFRIGLFNRETGNETVLGEDFDFQIRTIEWSEDSRSIVFDAADAGRYPLCRIEISTGRISRVSPIPSVRDFQTGRDGKIAFVSNSMTNPDELYIYDGQKDVRRLTMVNQAVVDEYDLRPFEEINIKGAGGQNVHTFVVKPHGFSRGKKYPTLLNIHGGPQGMWADAFMGNVQVFSGAGYVVVFPNPHGSLGYGSAYTQAISRDWGGKVYEDLMMVADHLEKESYVDTNRMGAMGWSYGGYMVNWILGHTDRFKALATTMGIFNLESFYGNTDELWFPEWDIGGAPWDSREAYRKWSPSTHAKHMKTPTLIISGEKDFRVSKGESVSLFTTLRRQGIPSRLILFPNDGHWLNPATSMPLYYAAHLDWFHRYLGGEASPYDPLKMIMGRAFN